jgi:hypothetical protein
MLSYSLHAVAGCGSYPLIPNNSQTENQPAPCGLANAGACEHRKYRAERVVIANARVVTGARDGTPRECRISRGDVRC